MKSIQMIILDINCYEKDNNSFFFNIRLINGHLINFLIMNLSTSKNPETFLNIFKLLEIKKLYLYQSFFKRKKWRQIMKNK